MAVRAAAATSSRRRACRNILPVRMFATMPVARHVGEVLELKYSGELQSGRNNSKSYSGQFDYGVSASTHAEEYCLDQTETARPLRSQP